MKHYLMNNLVVDVTKESPCNLVSHKINAKGREDKDDAFYIGDLGDVVRKHKLWMSQLSRVEPFYAVKCNDDPAVLATLAQLGTGFDCASKSEIQKILELKVDPERIVYANPCKQNSHIRYAAKHSVSMMTFDNEPELYKVKANYPNAKLIIRIAPPDDSKSQCQLGMKYGCSLKSVPKLLKIAKDLSLDVIGVSFHVGSGCYDSIAYSAAVAASRTVFDIAENNGFHFELLDIGGGFPGQESAKLSFQEICSVLRPSLDMYFPKSMGVRIIAEPGRFFVASAFTLAVNVISKRVVPREEFKAEDHEAELTANDQPRYMYYINDGVYGSFNCLLYDHATVEPSLLEDYHGEPVYSSSVWGPTCDGLDCVNEEVALPELDVGDWIVYRDMGAYTMCAASNFNGMPKPRSYYLMQDSTWTHFSANKSAAAACMGIIPALKVSVDAAEHHSSSALDISVDK